MITSIKKPSRKPLFGSHERTVTATLERRESGFDERAEQQYRNMKQKYAKGTGYGKDFYRRWFNVYANTDGILPAKPLC